jgi:moderate conductance mechanosensitive channel
VLLPGAETSCADNPDNGLCRLVDRVTGSETAADWANILLAKPGAILGLILLGIVLRAVLARVIDRLAKRAGEGTVPGVLQSSKARQMFLETNGAAYERRQQRTATMASLLKSVSTGVIFAIVAFMAIAQLGYNIAPLIASAGIIGVALGFGAQSLVTDFLSGIFMIIEDQYGVGDVVNVGTASGTVEAVGLRVTRLRDVDGTVWYVRNGEIMAVGNMSQNWARAVLDVPVGYRENLDRVRTVLRDVAHELATDPDYQAHVLEEPEVWGVERIDPEAVIMRVVIKTAPMEQWGVTRELRERVKARFDRLGIEIPLPQRVVLQRSGDSEPTPEPVAEPVGES